MNAFDSFPRLMVLFLAILLLEPLVSLMWPGIKDWSTVLLSAEIIIWLQWDICKGNENAINKLG